MSTLGSSSVSWNYYYYYLSGASNQAATVPYSIPQDAVIHSVIFYANAQSGSVNFVGCVWDQNGVLLGNSNYVSVGAGSDSVGGQSWITAALNATLLRSQGSQIKIGWTRPSGGSMLFSADTRNHGYIASGGDPGNLGSQTDVGQIGAYVVCDYVAYPFAVTAAATNIGATTATLPGSVGDGNQYLFGGGQSHAYFQYGTDPNLAGATTVEADNSPFGNSETASKAISGLAANTTYYFRVYCTNAFRTAYGSILSFTTTGAPNAPSLTSPANGATLDVVDNGLTPAWTYNSGGAGGGQTAYAIKFIVNGVSYWWDVANAKMQTVETWNPGSSGSATIPSGTTNWLAPGSYQWTAATKDAGGTGPYAALRTFSSVLPPNTPTLGSPTNNSDQPLSGSGGTFTGTFNGSSGGGTMQSYRLRRKLLGGASYEYWNAGTASWGAGATDNAATTLSAAFAAGKWTNNSIYQWSFATTDTNNLLGPYASDWVVIVQAAPSVSVTAPTGAQTLTLAPTAAWTDTLGGASGTVQTSYRLIVYNAAQYGAGGFSPGSGPSVYDTGVVNGAATGGLVLPLFANQTSYRAYVQITQTGGQTSAWAYASFNTVVNNPATPGITATFDATLARAILQLTAYDNLLTANQASLETDTTGWAALTNCSISRSTTQSLDGAASLRLSSTAAGDMSAETPTGASGVAVLPSTAMQALANFRAGATGRSCNVKVLWYQSNGSASAVRASDTSANITSTTTGWTQAALSVTSPSDAAYAAVVVQVLGTGGASELHYIDEIQLGPGNSGVWTAGGFNGATTALFECSDDGGITWATVRNGSAVTIPWPSQVTAVLYDYEGTPTATRIYRGTVQQLPTLSSTPSSTVSVVNSDNQNYWLKDPLIPGNNIKILVIASGQDVKQTEQSTSHLAMGRSTKIVVTDDTIGGEDGQIQVRTNDGASFANLRTLLRSQHSLLLQSPYGYQWYIRPDGDRTSTFVAGALNPYRITSVAYVEVSAP